MSKKTNKNFKLGLFVTIGILIFIVTIYYIGSQQSLFGSSVRVSAYFKNVGGLQVGNNVRYSGISIGTVESISIVSDTKIRVSMLIDEDASQFIKKDAEASIGSEGLMGNKVISISSGSEKAAPIGEDAVLSTVEPVEIDQILADLEKTGKHAQEIMINLEEITDHIKNGEGTIGRLLTDPKLVNNFDQMIMAYYRTGKNAEHFTQNLATVSDQLQNGKGTLGKLLVDSTFSNQIQGVADSLQSTMAHTAKVTENLERFTQNLNNKESTLGKLMTDTVMAEQVEQSILNIKDGSDDLEATIQKINNSWLLNLFNGKDKKGEKQAESLR